jgi:retrotransposon gag protein
MAPTETVGFTLTTPASQEQVKQAYDKAMKKYKAPEGAGPPGGSRTPPGGGGVPPGRGGPPGGEGPLGGGKGTPVGGGLPTGGSLPGAGQQTSDKTWGSLPDHFNGTRSKVDNFIDKLESYFCVNQLNAGLQSPIMKAAFTLTLIKGPEVMGWVKDMGEFLDNLDPIVDDVPEVWEQFLNNFTERFQDSTRKNQARRELENLMLKFPPIDEYMSKFKELACQVNYMAENPKT